MSSTIPFRIYLLCKEGENPRRQIATNEVLGMFADEPFYTIDGPDAESPSFISKCLPVHPNALPKLLPGFIACNTAHATAYADFLRSGAEHALILEDDVLFMTSQEVLLQAFRELPASYDWCKLVNVGWFPEMEAPGWERYGLIRRVNYPSWNSAAYFISRKGASYLLSHCIPQYTTIDCLFRFRSLGREVYNAVAPIAAPRAGMRSFIMVDDWKSKLKK